MSSPLTVSKRFKRGFIRANIETHTLQQRQNNDFVSFLVDVVMAVYFFLLFPFHIASIPSMFPLLLSFMHIVFFLIVENISIGKAREVFTKSRPSEVTAEEEQVKANVTVENENEQSKKSGNGK